MAPATPSAIDEAVKLLRDRISELDSERAKLERALASLTDGREGKRGPGRPRGSASTRPSTNGRKRRRSRRGGTRADHALTVIADEPGISASEIARRLDIKPNYMYRVLTELQADGKVRKEGRAYHPADPQPSGDPQPSSNDIPREVGESQPPQRDDVPHEGS